MAEVIDVRETKSFSFSETQNRHPHGIVFRVTNGLSLRYQIDYYRVINGYQETCPITISPEPDSEVSYEVELKHDGQPNEVFKFDRNVRCSPSGVRFPSAGESKVDLTFRVIYHELRTIPKPMYEDVEKFLFKAVKDVNLIGSDGQAGANLLLLKMRSPVFQAMFDEETSKEFQTKTVVIEEFPKESLAAFVHFLSTEEIKLPNENVVDLLRLGHKYQVPSLFSAAQRFILDHMNAENADALFEEFELLSKDVLKAAFKDKYVRK